jgi:hypothetical protein
MELQTVFLVHQFTTLVAPALHLMMDLPRNHPCLTALDILKRITQAMVVLVGALVLGVGGGLVILA